MIDELKQAGVSFGLSKRGNVLRADFREAPQVWSATVAQWLAALEQLRELNLCGLPVNDQQAIKLADLPKLKSIDLENTQLTDEGLSSLSQTSSLEIINVRGTPVTPQTVAALRKKNDRYPNHWSLNTRQRSSGMLQGAASIDYRRAKRSAHRSTSCVAMTQGQSAPLRLLFGQWATAIFWPMGHCYFLANGPPCSESM